MNGTTPKECVFDAKDRIKMYREYINDNVSKIVAKSDNAEVNAQYDILTTYIEMLDGCIATMTPAIAVDKLNGVAIGEHGPAFTAVYDMYVDHAFAAKRAYNNLRELL